MKLDSKLFDMVRIRPRRPQAPHASAPVCGWEGCERPGIYRAPKGHRAVGEYHHFCLEHVRAYNSDFNFFAGMDAEEIEAHVSRPPQPDQAFGHGAQARPAGRTHAWQAQAKVHRARFADPLNLFARLARNQAKGPQRERVRPLLEQDRRAFETLGLEGHAKSDEIKQQYKALVKKHHPDANGGDKSSEDRLRTIIAAFTHLRTKGFVSR